MSLLGGLLSFIPGVGPLLGMGADALSGMGKASAQNQGNQLTAAAQQAQIANQTAAQNDASRNSAWKNLLNADYVLNNQGYKPMTMPSSVPGMPMRTLPSFGIARQPFSGMARDAASGMARETMSRLQGGPQLKTPDLYGMSKPSAWQKILNVATPILTAAGNYKPGNDDYDSGGDN